MKRILALALAAVFVLTALTGCSKRAEDDKGAVIPMYVSDYLVSYDPVPMIIDAEMVVNTGMLYEGLTYLDDNGKVQKGVAVDWWTEIDEERGEYAMYFEINDETGWDDRITVQADNFVYAWRRVLSPETNSPAACLLYNIKNAKEYKSGLVTADDLGVYAESATLLKVEFTGPFDEDYFLETVASPALVAMREDLVDGNADWSTSNMNFAASAAFTMKGFEAGEAVTLQRNTSYRRDPKSDTNEWKVVNPYQLKIDFSQKEEDRLAEWENDMMFYISSFSKEAYETYEKDIDNYDLLSTYSYFFNTSVEPFNKKEVRQALSLALDRDEIAALAGKGTKPATGIVPYGVHDYKTSKSFRKAGGDVIETTAKLDEAKALLKSAGVKASSYSFEIMYKQNSEADKAIAQYAADVWAQLGFKVKISAKGTKNTLSAISSGDFEVVGFDYQTLTTDAFSTLAPFARAYSGSVVEIGADTDTTAPHFTGFDNKAYNELIDKIFSISDVTKNKDRAKLLHQAEEMLLDECPVIPLTFNVLNVMKSKDLKKVDSSIFGYRIFTKAKLSDYNEVKEALEQREAAELAADQAAA